MPSPSIKSDLSRMLGRRVTSMKRMGRGRNSRVYRLTCEDSGIYAAKFYFDRTPDDRDRMEVELSSMQFLRENGIDCIPLPVMADKTPGCVIYEYIEGQDILSSEVTEADIDAAVDFLGKLYQLKAVKGSRALPPASEACFSVKAIVSNVQCRLDTLSSLRNIGAAYDALHDFLSDDFVPSFEEITQWCRSSMSRSAMSYDAELPREARTLSPSDFGFHNALRRADGHLVFFDFEYFGWDDPAKMVSDFLLHSAMRLSKGLKRRFVAGILGRFRDPEFLDKRVQIVYPMFGLKWCLILLNEFVPEILARRGFAGKNKLDKDKLQAAQLVKARRMLHRVVNEYRHFPYHAGTPDTEVPEAGHEVH